MECMSVGCTVWEAQTRKITKNKPHRLCSICTYTLVWDLGILSTYIQK